MQLITLVLLSDIFSVGTGRGEEARQELNIVDETLNNNKLYIDDNFIYPVQYPEKFSRYYG